jgi:CheY-like chemotaxis protein
MMSPMWRFCSASSFGATFARAASRWSLPNLPQWRSSASPDAAGVSLILIITDISMPGMSGIELLPKAKALRPDVPVIMITAYGDAETKRKALENGAEALLTKPIDFGTLRSEIDMRVERAA